MGEEVVKRAYRMPGGGTGGWTEERLRKIPTYKSQIIEMLADEMFFSEIALQLQIAPGVIREWRQMDKDFDEQCSDAESAVTDRLEKEAIRRATRGVKEPVVSAGKVVMDTDGTPLMVRRYSDGLMQFLLRGRRREVYGDKREIDAKVGIDVVGAKDSLQAKFASAQLAVTDESST